MSSEVENIYPLKIRTRHYEKGPQYKRSQKFKIWKTRKVGGKVAKTMKKPEEKEWDNRREKIFRKSLQEEQYLISESWEERTKARSGQVRRAHPTRPCCMADVLRFSFTPILCWVPKFLRTHAFLCSCLPLLSQFFLLWEHIKKRR